MVSCCIVHVPFEEILYLFLFEKSNVDMHVSVYALYTNCYSKAAGNFKKCTPSTVSFICGTNIRFAILKCSFKFLKGTLS